MKYTRYDIKSKKKDDWKTTIAMLLGVLLVALISGSFIFNKFFRGENNKTTPKTSATEEGGTPEVGGDNQSGGETVVPPVVDETKETSTEDTTASAEQSTYTMIQCGVFSTVENARAVKEKVGKGATIIEEEGKFRVISYVGTEKIAGTLSDSLTTNGIENTKIRIKMSGESLIDKSIKEMLNGILDMTSKLLTDTEIASVKTADFKTWTASLKEDVEGDRLNEFKTLREKISSLPEEITIDTVEPIYKEVYGIVKNYK